MSIDMKRANDAGDLLQVVPEEIIMEVLLILFPHVSGTQKDIEDALTIRETSKLMRCLIDKYLFLPVKSLRECVSCLLTDQMVPLFPGLEYLSFSCKPCMTEKGLVQFKQLQSLYLDGVVFQPETFKSLTNLKKLTLMRTNLKKECLFALTNLECLELFLVESITDDTLDHLPQLKQLTISNPPKRTPKYGHAITKMTRLEKLYLDGPFHIDSTTLLPLANTLVDLGLNGHFAIPDEILSKMVNLKSLSLENNGIITDTGIIGLTNLTKLVLCSNTVITAHGLSRMSRLTELNLEYNTRITLDALEPFRKTLETIDIADSMIRDYHCLTHEAFPALRLINSFDEHNNIFFVVRNEKGEEMQDDHDDDIFAKLERSFK